MLKFKNYVNGPTISEWTQAMMMIGAAELHEEYQISEDITVPAKSDGVQSHSAHPDYDKETAHAMYGAPVEDKDGTKKAIETENARRAANKQKPLTPNKEKFHKQFQHITNGSKGVAALFKTYGDSDKSIISAKDRASEVNSNFDKFSEMRKNDRPGYTKRVKEMKDRKDAANLTSPIADKSKTDTVSTLPGKGKNEKNGHISVGFGGNPDTRRLYTDTKGSYVEGNACQGKGACVHACLAKSGCGGFDTVKGHRGAYDQRSMHNAAAREDHDLELHDQLHRVSEKAKKEGKAALVRPDVSTGHQNTEYSDAIAKHFGPDSEKVAKGEGHPVRVSAYGKNTGTDTDPHDITKGKNTTISDQGIPRAKSTIERYKKDNALLRQKGKHARIAYTVMDTSFSTGSGEEHTDPKKKADYEKIAKTTHVYRHDVEPTTPDKGEPEEYHDEKAGYGRTLHKGKSYKYSIHKTPPPSKDINGADVPSRMHDDRGGELERHIEKNPHDHGINAVAPATESSNPESGSKEASIFHHTSNIVPHHNPAQAEKDTGVKNAHVLHIMHPASPEAENARRVISGGAHQPTLPSRK